MGSKYVSEGHFPTLCFKQPKKVDVNFSKKANVLVIETVIKADI